MGRLKKAQQKKNAPPKKPTQKTPKQIVFKKHPPQKNKKTLNNWHNKK